MSRVFGVAKIRAKSNGVLTVVPVVECYFEPKRVRFRSFDCTGESLGDLDFRIGAVCVGGSPQLAVNTLQPDGVCRSGSLSSRDLDKTNVNWSTFSTRGLARELEISIYNPHDVDLLIYACLEGSDIPSLDCYGDYPPFRVDMSKMSDEELELDAKKREDANAESEKKLEKIHKEMLEKQAAKEERWRSGGFQQVGSEVVELKPFERRSIQVIPTVSPYFEPFAARYHCHRASDGADASILLVDAISSTRMMFGGLLYMEDWWTSSTVTRLRSGEAVLYNESPYDTLAKLKSQIELLGQEGMDGIERRRKRDIERIRTPKVNGMPTDLLHDPRLDDWHEISDFPIFSTTGLAKHLHFLVYNPWSFNVSASVTICGHAMSSLQNSVKPDIQLAGREGKP